MTGRQVLPPAGHPVRVESATASNIVTSDTECYRHRRRFFDEGSKNRRDAAAPNSAIHQLFVRRSLYMPSVYCTEIMINCDC